MTVIVKDRETDALVRALAERTGESLTGAIKTAVREKLQRLPLTDSEIAARKKKLARLAVRADALPTLDKRGADDILDYNASGHFD